jgi:hypothetical protein
MKTGLLPLILLPVLLCALPARAQDQPTPPATPPPPAPAADSAPAAPAIDPAKAAEIRKLLDLSGTTKEMNMMLDQMISSFKSQNSDVPTEFWDRFKAEINVQGLEDKLMPLYDKYYTTDDLKALIAFYQTPAGQHMLSVTPKLMQESMQIGEDWGRSVGMKVNDEIEKERQKEAAPAAPSSAPSTSASAAPAPTTASPSAPAPAPASS